MSHPSQRRHTVLGLTTAVALALSGATAAGAAPSTAPSATEQAVARTAGTPAEHTAPAVFEDGAYIVLLAEDPVATYTGGLSGYAATKPAEGSTQKLDAASPAAKRSGAMTERMALMHTSVCWIPLNHTSASLFLMRSDGPKDLSNVYKKNKLPCRGRGAENVQCDPD